MVLNRFPRGLAVAVLLSFPPIPVLAQGAMDSDWLIERWNGQWGLVSKGPAGRVEKTAPNQEVLRMGADGRVLVVSMPALAEDESLHCFASRRSDHRSSCSSAFLACSNSNDGAYVTLFNGLLGFNMADIRSRLECRIDSSAVLRAARAVGMISTILPVAEKARPSAENLASFPNP